MPIYEYRCQECRAEFEKLVFGSGADQDIRCPECRSAEIEQVYSASTACPDPATGARTRVLGMLLLQRLELRRLQGALTTGQGSAVVISRKLIRSAGIRLMAIRTAAGSDRTRASPPM